MLHVSFDNDLSSQDSKSKDQESPAKQVRLKRTLRLSASVDRQTFASGEVTHLIMREATARWWAWRRGSGGRCRTQRRRTSWRRCVAGHSRRVDRRRRSGGWWGTGRRRRRCIPVIILRHVGTIFPRCRHAMVSIRRVVVLARRNTDWRRNTN